MNRRPTPETDAESFSTVYQGELVEANFARRLERERDEALEECAKWHGMAIEADKRFVESVLVRDEESKKSRREHDLANEAIATWQKTRDERDALQEQLDEVRVERDEWKQKFIQQNKDLGCEMMDPGGTIWDYAKKLQDDIAGWETKWKIAVDMAAIAENERDEVKQQLDAAIMLGKMQERRHERELEKLTVHGIHTCHDQCQRPVCALSRELYQERDKANRLIAAAKAVIDRWETPFWKEAEHTGAYIAALRKAVEIAEGGYL